jgi:major vault protein
MAEITEKELVLAHGEQATIQDSTKGDVVIYVGPTKASLSNTDVPVRLDPRTRRFVPCGLHEAKASWALARDGQYLVLDNPSVGGKHPAQGRQNLPDLEFGKVIVVPGPAMFATWPGQIAETIDGHSLRSNQYLVALVTNEEQARENWGKAVMKKAIVPSGDGEGNPDGPAPIPEMLVLGQRLIIKGTETSFFIPPTGITVVKDDTGRYVREAATLERLEYCILLDEDGNKRYMQGPAVVFPAPTEKFVEQNGTVKFRAVELTELSGIYVKVVAPYEELGTHLTPGQELFITGKEQPVYFPRAEHNVITYGGQTIHHSTAIPKGEARYVLNRETGEVALVRGPQMFLPDPRKEVIVRRALTPQQVALWYPGNARAAEVNETLAQSTSPDDAMNGFIRGLEKRGVSMAASATSALPQADRIDRSTTYTPPRTITLDTKYDGAVAVDVWQGYAVMVLDRTGGRRVVVGPTTVLLEYDETLMPMHLSTGKPKTTDRLHGTVYLRTSNNKVSDIVTLTTSDLCEVSVKLSYRVNFHGETDEDRLRWFSAENYVKLLCDHLRSMLKGVAKKTGIEALYANGAAIIRDTILGASSEGHKRPGRIFDENGMQVYDVEVLDLTITDSVIAGLLMSAQRENVRQSVMVAQTERTLEITKRTEAASQESLLIGAQTKAVQQQILTDQVAGQMALDLAGINAQITTLEARIALDRSEQVARGEISELRREQDRLAHEQRLAIAKREAELVLKRIDAEVSAVKAKAEAISPQLIAAMTAFSDKALLAELSKSFASLSILEDKSVVDLARGFFSGTPLANLVGLISNLPAKSAE